MALTLEHRPAAEDAPPEAQVVPTGGPPMPTVDWPDPAAHELDDAAIGRSLRFGLTVGTLAMAALTFVICLVAGASPWQAAEIAPWLGKDRC